MNSIAHSDSATHNQSVLLTAIASESVAIAQRGWYEPPGCQRVDIRLPVERAIAGTKLYTPSACQTLAEVATRSRFTAPTVIEVTTETTAEAARRLAATSAVVALNFASAKNPGGGFLRGTKAQEEDLARCSALYACLATKPEFYAANRAKLAPSASGSMLHTDHLIYSPDVPFFRDENLALLHTPFVASIITSPAPNARMLAAYPVTWEATANHATLVRRAAHILAVAAHHGHQSIVLGAWGCGVFMNNPREVASVFADLLADSRFSGVFARVVFAICDTGREQPTLHAFMERFER